MFFTAAIGNNEVPEKIALDGSQASHQAVAELKAEGVLPAQNIGDHWPWGHDPAGMGSSACRVGRS